MSRCVIICSSPDYCINTVKSEIIKEDFVICADGGLDIAKEAEVYVNLAIGDFDSIKGDIPNYLEKIVLPVEKDETDTMYAVKEGVKRGFDDFILLCGTGGRIDHSIANLYVIYYLSKLKKKGALVSKDSRILCLEDASIEISGKEKSLVSVFPFNCGKCRVSYNGMAYEMNEEILYSNSTRGISNFMSSKLGVIEVHTGSALVVIERDSKVSWLN